MRSSSSSGTPAQCGLALPRELISKHLAVLDTISKSNRYQQSALKMLLRGRVPAGLYNQETAEVLKLGLITCYIFEDGSNTDSRVGCITLVLPRG